MHRRLWIAAGAVFAVCGVALTAGGAYAYYFDSNRADVIAVGVQIAGIDVGGLHAAQAQQLLDDRLAERLRGPVAVVSRPAPVHGPRRGVPGCTWTSRRWSPPPCSHRAAAASRTASSATSGGQPLHETIPLQAGSRPAHVETFVDQVARVARPARAQRARRADDARDRLAHHPVAARSRRQAPAARARARNRAPRLRRAAHAHRADAPVHPRWWTSTLKRRYGTYCSSAARRSRCACTRT